MGDFISVCQVLLRLFCTLSALCLGIGSHLTSEGMNLKHIWTPRCVLFGRPTIKHSILLHLKLTLFITLNEC
jgi:hypothetical protein